MMIPAESVWTERLNLGHQVGCLGPASGFPVQGMHTAELPQNPQDESRLK